MYRVKLIRLISEQIFTIQDGLSWALRKLLSLWIRNCIKTDHRLQIVRSAKMSWDEYEIQKSFYISLYIGDIGKSDRSQNWGTTVLCTRWFKTIGWTTEIGRFNGDYFSELFEECVKRHSPKKEVTLHCLRHTASAIMENNGIKDPEIDDTLGHYNVKTALKNYQNRTKRVVAIRLSKKRKKELRFCQESRRSLRQISLNNLVGIYQVLIVFDTE